MKKQIFTFLAILLSAATFAQVAINNDASLPDPSAMLDIKSDTAGILIPRMTAVQRDAINNPAQGLIVYVTDDNNFYYYNGSQWANWAGGADNDWTVVGNDMYSAPSGKVGIGTNSPNAKLDIYTNTEATNLKLTNYTSSSYNSKIVDAYIYGADNKDLTGFSFFNNNSGSGTHFGLKNVLSGSGSGTHCGVYNDLANGSGHLYGMFNDLRSGNANDQYGIYNKFTQGGNGTRYGMYSYFGGYATGDLFGSKTLISNAQTGNHYGSFSRLQGTGNGNKYGSYIIIPTSAGGTHYGLYSDVSGNSNYAAYLLGRTYISDSLGIGTDSPQAELDVNGHIRMTDGNEAAGKVLVSDANGQASWGNAGDADFYKANTAHQVPKSITDTIYTQGSVAIGTTAPDASAKLEVNSTVQGFLPPRMTATQMNALASPAEGLMVYNTTVKSVCFYDGSAWHKTYNNDGISCGDISYGGQTYSTVVIGTQCWMAENLNIGTAILGSQDQTDNGVIEKYCYDDQTSNCDTYGGLYQWDEMMQYVTTEGTQGICPTGWHLPTDTEYKTMEMHLGMTQAQADATDWRGTYEGSKMAGNEPLWSDGNLDQNANFGSSGFTLLPAGYRYTDGSFIDRFNRTYLWSSSENGTNAWFRELDYYYQPVYRNYASKAYGFSVRCIKD